MRRSWLLLPFFLTPLAQAMQALDDEGLAEVNGQSGISIEHATSGWTAGSINYNSDGTTLSAKTVSLKPQAGTGTDSATLDVVGQQLQVEYSAAPRELNVSNLEFAGSSKSFGAFRAFFTLGASLRLKGLGASGVSGIALDGSRLSISDATFFYRDNGLDLIVKGVSFDTYLNNAYLDIVSGGTGSEVKLSLGNSRFVGAVGGILVDLAHSELSPVTPGALDTRHPDASRSFGRVNMDLRLGGSLSIAGGGNTGQGLTIKPNVSFSNSLFQYQDEGVLRAENFAGTLRSTSGITVDLEQDGTGSYARLAFADLNLNATLGGLVMGNPTNQKLGSLALDLNFMNDGSKQNWLKLRPGGDPSSGLKGLTADVSWNMANSSLSVTDNGNSMWFSGLKTNGTGQFTLDVTKGCSDGFATGCYAGSVSTNPASSNYDGHFNGIRLGMKNVQGSYSFDGLRVGSASSPLQGGTELLVLMEIFPAYDFIMNGQITLMPGGSSGDGLRYNADFMVTNGKAAITVDETGKGLWLSGTTYELHFRDGSLDVTNNGVELKKGTYWSKLDVSDVRWGNKDTGTSLGRLVLKRYEQGSTLALSSGGSGALCVGASGASSSACTANGGRWEDRGNEGVSVKLKAILAKDGSIEGTSNGVVTDEKRNQLIYETDRTLDGNGKPINGSGSQIVVDNVYTSDGNPVDPNANTYGVNADLSLDVAPTKVKIKSGPNAGTQVSPDPLGFAVNGRVHFKEINIDRLQNVHPTGGAVTAMYGIKLQNADVRANLTATPIN